MQEGIFISYRRDDSKQAAGRLGDSLEIALGRERIFRDIEDIQAGTSFAEALNTALARCSAMVVVIGPSWLTVVDRKTGVRRLDQPEDWIRAEIVAAMTRKIPVIPVLMDGAAQPTADDLPEALKPLAGLQSLKVEDERWRSDVQRLVDVLSRSLGLPPAAATPAATASPAGKGRLAGAAVAALVLAGVAYGAWDLVFPPADAPEPQAVVNQTMAAPSPLLGVWEDGGGRYEISPGATAEEFRVVYTPAAEPGAAADATPPAAWPAAIGIIRDDQLNITGSDPDGAAWTCSFMPTANLQSLKGSCVTDKRKQDWSLTRASS